MKDLKIKLWNDDELTIPYVNCHYRSRTVINHIKMLLKSVEQAELRKEERMA